MGPEPNPVDIELSLLIAGRDSASSSMKRVKMYHLEDG